MTTKTSRIASLRIISILFYSLICLNFTLSAQTVLDTYGRLQVNGNKVTSETGEEISLAGMSMFWTIAGDTSDFYNAESVDFLVQDWKISIIRVAMGIDESWDNGNGYVDGESGRQFNLNKIEPVIQAAIDNGIYVIIDWHSHNAEDFPNEAKEFFSYISSKYGANKNIIYEIYNEPLNTTPWNTVKSYARPVIEEIRKNDPENLIIVGTPTWSQDVDKPAADQNWISDPNLAYTLHFYANTHKQSLRDKAKAAMDSGIALFVTEWGSTDASGNGGYNPEEATTWINFMKENKISHVNWTVSDKNETSCVVNPGGGVNALVNGQITTAGAFIRAKILEQAVNPTLSISEINTLSKDFTVSPIPAKEIINIQSDTTIDTVILADMTGKILIKDEQSRLNPSIAINHLQPGNYIISMISKNNSSSQLITIKR